MHPETLSCEGLLNYTNATIRDIRRVEGGMIRSNRNGACVPMWLYRHLDEDDIEALNLKKAPRWKAALMDSHMTVCQMCESRRHQSKHFIEAIVTALKYLETDTEVRSTSNRGEHAYNC